MPMGALIFTCGASVCLELNTSERQIGRIPLWLDRVRNGFENAMVLVDQ